MIPDRARKQRLKNVYTVSMQENKKFSEFQSEIMMFASREFSKVMQNKYASPIKNEIISSSQPVRHFDHGLS